MFLGMLRPAIYEVQLPKLDVAGSIPVSRSILSISYANPFRMESVRSPLSTNRLFQRVYRIPSATE
jgi:hypothetical protein